MDRNVQNMQQKIVKKRQFSLFQSRLIQIALSGRPYIFTFEKLKSENVTAIAKIVVD